MSSKHLPQASLLSFHSCDLIDKLGERALRLTWETPPGEHWLITGTNGGGKEALSGYFQGSLTVVPEEEGSFLDPCYDSTVVVSLEQAAALIEEERRRDDSDFVEGGVDPGRTPRILLLETLSQANEGASNDTPTLDSHPIVELCGIQGILDRGIKYLSTGEIRRTLLCLALVSNSRRIVLDDPFDGLDAGSRARLTALLEGLFANARIQVFLLSDRFSNVPNGITHVLELRDSSISFMGTREEYEQERNKRALSEQKILLAEASSRASELEEAILLRHRLGRVPPSPGETLVEMNNVKVEWSGRRVIDGLSWRLSSLEHWLIRGPNGSGKTTFLELITGDNPQCYSNDIRVFGMRRGGGESIWDIKRNIGIVSYRLHVEHRTLSGLTLEEVLLSGLHDSIGLYEHTGHAERELASRWLSISRFTGKANAQFEELSYGEQRALLIARAAIKCPHILILDEPCHGLDDASRTRVLSLLESIGSGGVSTILHVTHDPTEVLPCETRTLELLPEESPMYRIGAL
jgi:molybdate transport system ATP-binding protein